MIRNQVKLLYQKTPVILGKNSLTCAIITRNIVTSHKIVASHVPCVDLMNHVSLEIFRNLFFIVTQSLSLSYKHLAELHLCGVNVANRINEASVGGKSLKVFLWWRKGCAPRCMRTWKIIKTEIKIRILD